MQTAQSQIPSFEAPGPGTWEFDAAHFSRPLSPLLAEVFEAAFPVGMRTTMERHGMLLDTIDCRMVHGFPFMQPRPVGAPPGAKEPPRWLVRLLLPAMIRLHPTMRRRLATARVLFERRPWCELLRDWDERLRDESVAAHTQMCAIDPASLDDDALAEHLLRVRDHGIRFLAQDHSMNGSMMLPVGDFLVHARQWTGLSDAQLLHLLRGSSAISAGDSHERRRLVAAIQADPEARALLDREAPALEVLEALTHWSGEVGPAMRAYRVITGNAITIGIDLESPCVDEDPGPMLLALRRVVRGEAAASASIDEQATTRARERVPPEYREAFDTLLEDARAMYRLRDERHLYGAMPVVGIARKTCCTIGRRLVARGRLERVEDVFTCDCDTLVALLRGEAVDVDWEHRRKMHALSADVVPTRLGPPAGPPPDPRWLPAPMARAMRALEAYMGAMEVHEAGEPVLPRDQVEGLGVSAGVHEGIARLCSMVEDLARIEPGDVLVAPLTTSAINVVLPILGAIVTDRGGALSHPAIVSREFGIPGVVGTRDATRRIPDGARVRVDGDRGVVELL